MSKGCNMIPKSFVVGNRSSTIFPIYLSQQIQSKLSFLNYWEMKNSVNDTYCVMTLRDKQGQLIEKKPYSLEKGGAHEISVQDFFNIESPSAPGFYYTLEFEIFFKTPPLYNYPALSLIITNKTDSSIVHSCLRSYDEGESQGQHSLELEQGGFDILSSREVQTHLILSSSANDLELTLNFLSESGASFSKNLKVSTTSEFALVDINLSEEIENNYPESSENYTCSIKHNCDTFFPRFYIARISKKEFPPCLTHTFFNQSSSAIDNPSDYIKTEHTDLNCEATFSVPLLPNIKTEISSYKTNSPSRVKVCLDFYEENGGHVGQVIDSKELHYFNESFQTLNLSALCKESILNFSKDSTYSAKFSFSQSESLVPKRLKFGLNLYKTDKRSFASNVCFAAFSVTNEVVTKRLSRRWGAIGGKENLEFIINNTESWFNDLEGLTEYTLSFFNSNSLLLDKTVNLEKNATLVVSKDFDQEVSNHLDGKLGQVFVSCKKPFFDAWCVSIGENLIGADHAF